MGWWFETPHGLTPTQAARAAREIASAAGLDRYTTGRPCRQGRDAARYVSSGACVECGVRRHSHSARQIVGPVASKPADGLCEICREPKPLHVDHDHSTNRFRGWLCNGCNVGLGMFKDCTGNLHAAALYLDQAKTEQSS